MSPLEPNVVTPWNLYNLWQRNGMAFSAPTCPYSPCLPCSPLFEYQFKYHPRTILAIHQEGEDVLRSCPGSAAQSWGSFIIAVALYHAFSRLRAGLALRKDVVWNGPCSLSWLWLCNGSDLDTMLDFNSWRRRFGFCAPGSMRFVLYQLRRRKQNCFGLAGCDS